MPQIPPITDPLATTKISGICHAKREPGFTTENTYSDSVVMSLENHEDMSSIAAIDTAIGKAESEYARTHESHDAHTALISLRGKYFG